MEPFETIVANLGFSISISLYLLVRIEGKLQGLTYVAGPLPAKNGTTMMYRCKNNVYLSASIKYTRVIYV